MSMISDHKERTTPLSGTELAIIEDETGLRGVKTELLRGLQGPQGETGPQGPQGIQGDTGPQGSQGPQGETGPIGPQGVPGPAGAQGATGPMPDLASPGPIGSTKPDAGDFSSLTVKSTLPGAATFGAEMVTNGGFTGHADGWTLGANWAYANNAVVATVGNGAIGELSCTLSGLELDQFYAISWTQTCSVANNAKVYISSDYMPYPGTLVGYLGILGSGTFRAVFQANSTYFPALPAGTIRFSVAGMPDATGTVTIDNVSIKKMTVIPPGFAMVDTATGISKMEARLPMSSRGEAYSRISSIALGGRAGQSQTSGYNNVAFGDWALRDVQDGFRNVAMGRGAMYKMTGGNNSVGIGDHALGSNLMGINNVAVGSYALCYGHAGSENTAVGRSALLYQNNGSTNTAVGRLAGCPNNAEANSLTSANNCTFIGAYSGFGSATQYDAATAIGYRALVTSANTVVLGRTTDNTVIGATGDDGSGDKLQVTGKARASAGGRFGSETDNLSIGPTGHLTLNGAATYWDDLLVEMRESLKGSNAKPDWDTVNMGLLFPQNDPTEFIMLNMQLPHRWKEGSTIFPHVHIQQAANQNPVFKLDYRWINFGDAIPSTWSTYVMDSLATAYTSGTISNILKGAGISGAGKTISSILQMKLYRGDNAYTGDVLAMSFDVHIECDSLGSNSEYTK